MHIILGLKASFSWVKGDLSHMAHNPLILLCVVVMSIACFVVTLPLTSLLSLGMAIIAQLADARPDPNGSDFTRSDKE